MAEDLVVGIDVGVSGTGVAYRRKGHAEPPKLVGWGTEVPDDSVEHLKLHEWFKVDLGEVDGDNGQVKSLYRDFLTSLYGELSTKRFTPASLGGKNFEEAEVLFLFSVPAIWDPAVVRDFTQLVRDSGFERVGLHSVRVTMTEPQAIAAYEICVPNLDYQLKNGENVLIVDAGGGTTDFCLLKMNNTYEKPPQAMELAPPTTCAIGSSYIDRGFEEMVVTIFRTSVISCNRFRICKHEFNPDKFRDLTFNISFKTSARDDLRDPPPPPSFVLAGESLGSLFDSQIDEINQHIRRFARAFGTDSETNSENHLDYIVLAGGLGSSRYVLGKIEEFIGKSQINFTAKTKVVMSAAPRLSVCMGLVYNAGRNPELFPRRFNRVSVGVASQSLTGAIKKTRLRDLIKRALLRFPKGKKPEGEVEWFLIKGGLVPDRVAVHEQTAYFSADLPSDKRIWELGILASFESDIERLTLEDNCRVHSVLKVKLSHIGEPEQTGTRDALSRLHLARKPKIQIKFDLRVEVGLATVEIQCTDKKMSICSEPISIETGQASESQPPICQHVVHELS
ncbi:hypothetical protein AU210_005112 [Fusarium oxysporum f. sp. radicis-cucumerinum]|uniref:Uncharacterized protein n=1 Tax=Fusarium oxysporum f. sp. radicis-cucumerinum TaxID=327505 RepID=A0A2H3HIB3_FUSOX|nr:hypothetical protein AU210_005112 [Fusarium oxysporum f. sp. radicis-cucumerinum]